MNRRDEQWGGNGEEQDWRRYGRDRFAGYGDERRGQRHGVGYEGGHGGYDAYEGAGRGRYGGGYERERDEPSWRGSEYEGGYGGGEGRGGRQDYEAGRGGRGYGYAEDRPRRGGPPGYRGRQEQGPMGGGSFNAGSQYESDRDRPTYGDWQQQRREHSMIGGDFRQGHGDVSRYGAGSGQWERQGGHGGEGRGRGLPQGPFVGKGPRGYKRSPDRLKEQVCDLLEQHGEIDASDIDVKVEEDCTVTLSGNVDSRRTKRLAEDLAESVAGIRDVQNHLRVQSSRESMPGSQGTQTGIGGTQIAGTQEPTREASAGGAERSGSGGSKRGA